MQFNTDKRGQLTNILMWMWHNNDMQGRLGTVGLNLHNLDPATNSVDILGVPHVHRPPFFLHLEPQWSLLLYPELLIHLDHNDNDFLLQHTHTHTHTHTCKT